MSVVSQTPRLFLIGFSGSGKSTVGPLLAHRLKARFIDSDSEIERQAKTTIAQLFERRGEKHFRALESDLIRKLSLIKEPCVVALGGGAFEQASNRKMLQSAGRTIYLSCSVAELYRRLKNQTDRPLLGRDRNAKLGRIKSLLERRLRSYQLADITISTTSRTPHQTAMAIAKKFREDYADHQNQSR